MKSAQIDAAAPAMQVTETVSREQRLETCTAHEGALGGAVEAPQPGVTERERDRPARAQVLGVARVIGGGEGDATCPAVAAHGKSERAFGGDVDGVRAQSLELARHVGPGR